MIRKESHELLQSRLAVNFAIQALRAFISEPGLGDVAVGDDVAVTGLGPGGRKFISLDRTATPRSHPGIIVSGLNRLAGFVRLGLGITKRPAGSSFDEHVRTGDQTGPIAV